jgi:uncharacterized protein (TIGR01777 family)
LTVAVTGASGFVGRHLVEGLLERGHFVVALSRSPRHDERSRVRRVVVEPASSESWRSALAGVDAVVHLAGEGIVDGRWTKARRERIRSSRVDVTCALVEGLRLASSRPATLVAASAIGYYGARDADVECDEDASPGDDFLAEVCVAWEAEARRAETLGVRVVNARFGIVLGRDGGAYEKMRTPFRWCVGGRVGSGDQVWSWIHVDDLVSLLVAAVEDPRWRGPVNAVAPGAVANREFAKAMGRALHRPAIVPVPAFALRILLGKAASFLTTGQRVVPRAATENGFLFRFPDVDSALEDLAGPRRSPEPAPAA